MLRHRRLLAVGCRLLAVAQRLGLVPRRMGVARLAIRTGRRLRSTGDDVWLFTGCVMDAWLRGTHRSTASLISVTGAGYRVAPRGTCCGALALHAGLADEARRCATATIAAHPGRAPVLVNAAGCGAVMREYGELLGSAAAAEFATRVLDVHEWLGDHLDATAANAADGDHLRVIVQDPCHLRHVQRAHGAVRRLLGTVADVVELDDDGLCCGAGGAYSVTRPELAADIRARKVAAIERAGRRSGATIVASANPGCMLHLRAAGVDARHPTDIVAEAAGMTVSGAQRGDDR